MKNEKYVCLLGDFVYREEKIKGAVSNYWIFEKMKTKKGYDSYFKDDRR